MKGGMDGWTWRCGSNGQDAMRARRAPFTDARDGRLKSRVRRAFRRSRGEPLTTTDLMKLCRSPLVGREIQELASCQCIASC